MHGPASHGSLPLALLCVATLVGTWVALSELLQGLQVGWSKPWFILYAIHGPGYATILPVWWCLRRRRQARAPLSSPLVSYRVLLPRAGGLALVSAFCSYAWYQSLAGTMAASNNAIFQSGAVAVYALSVPLLGEAVVPSKLAAVAVAVGGVCLVSFAGAAAPTDSAQQTATPAGYSWLLASVLTYALYEVLFALAVQPRAAAAAAAPDEQPGAPLLPPLANATRDEEAAWALFMRVEQAAFIVGAIGVWSLVVLLPGFPLLSATGVEPFAWPSRDKAQLLVVDCALDTAYNLALLVGIVASTPLLMSLGTMLVVPSTVVADWALHGQLPSPQAGVGIFFILVSFVALQLRPPGWWGRALPHPCGRGARREGGPGGVRGSGGEGPGEETG